MRITCILRAYYVCCVLRALTLVLGLLGGPRFRSAPPPWGGVLPDGSQTDAKGHVRGTRSQASVWFAGSQRLAGVHKHFYGPVRGGWTPVFQRSYTCGHSDSGAASVWSDNCFVSTKSGLRAGVGVPSDTLTVQRCPGDARRKILPVGDHETKQGPPMGTTRKGWGVIAPPFPAPPPPRWAIHETSGRAGQAREVA